MFVSEIIDEVIEVLGRCDRSKAIQRISDAVAALQDEGDWNANIGMLDIRTFDDGDLVTLPREVETPLAVVIDGVPVFMRDEFFRFHLNGDGLLNERVVPWVWDDHGSVGSFMDIKTPGPVIARCDLASDAGKLVRVMGLDSSARPLRQQLEDGQWIDGITVPFEFISGAPTSAPSFRQFRRIFQVSPINTFVSNNHELVTGAYMQVSLLSGTIPTPIESGARYYIRVTDVNRVSLHRSRLDARTGQGPIELETAASGTTLTFADLRTVSTRTQFQTTGNSDLSDFDLVTFLGTQLPDPINSSVSYVIKTNGADKFSIFENIEDAQVDRNVINVTTPGNTVSIRALKPTFPFTTLNFSVAHNYLTGDAVTVVNTGGEIPSPLLAGTNYFVRVINNISVTLHPSLNDAISNTNQITLTSLGSGTNSLVKIIAATSSLGNSSNITTTLPHNLSGPSGSGAIAIVSDGVVNTIAVNSTGSGYTSPPTVTITGGGGSGATATAVVISNQVSAINVTNGGSGYTSDPTVTLSGGGGSGASATATVAPSGQNVSSILVTNGGSNYQAAPIIQITGGGGNGATAQGVVSGGVLTSIQVITGGTGYTSLPTVQIIAAGSSFVSFTSNGTLPAPITQGTVYRAEAPLTTNTFTLNSTVPQPINITSLGSGQLFMIVSRAFTLGFVPQWQVDATAYVTGQAVRFYTDGTLPTTSPAIDQSTLYYLRKLNNAVVEVYDTLFNAQNLSSTTGRFSTISLGSEQLYFSVEKTVTAVVRDNFLDIEFAGYLQNFTDVKFETTGTLPSPLATATTYQLSIVDGKIEIYTAGGSLVTLTSVGNGQHTMALTRTFSVVAATSLDIPGQQYAAGDLVDALSTETLPLPLTASSYYVRPISSNQIELYDTQFNAENAPSTTGRVTFTSIGSGIHRLLQNLPPFVVASIDRIEKEITDGFCRIYAWDIGRTSNLAMLADMQPGETTTAYRRIKIDKNAKWVRMRYRRRSLALMSDRDFINLDSKMAIVTMVQSQDLLIKRFVEESERYRMLAVEYLNKRNRAIDGARTATLQINADVMNRPDDWMD
jgi:hypothetical protein